MKAMKLFVSVIAFAMITSGLSMISFASNNHQNDIDQAPVDNVKASTPCGGQRFVHMEDFTNWGCGPCASHNPGWTGAINAKGYTMVAPAYTHVHWPSSTDPMNNYDNMYTWANNRRTMYGITGVPSAWVDGANVGIHQGQAAYEAIIDERLCVPARVKIDTTGSTIGGGSGEVVARITALEDLPASDYRVIVYLWETNITRTLNGDPPPYPNGETQLDWAVWLMLNNEAGQSIWTSGATKGDYVDISRPFTMGAGWVESEMGATVFVQDFNTFDIENSAVELFNGYTPPGRDMVVYGNGVPTEMDATKPYTLDCVVYNSGDYDETNVDVSVTLDGVPQASDTVPFIESDQGAFVSVDWVSPGPGTYILGFEVTPVAGETVTYNNIWTTTITVSSQPDIWLAPMSFDFTVAPDSGDVDTLTVGNDGTAALNYNINIGTATEIHGSWDAGTWAGGVRDRGNVYHATTSTTLWEFAMYLTFAASTDMYFAVYEGAAITGTYNRIHQNQIASTGTGTGFFSSGPITVSLTAGYYYYFAAIWNGAATYGRGIDAVPIATTFGTLETGIPGSLSGYPPAASVSNSYTGYSPYYMRVTTGPGSPAWLDVNPLSGSVGTGSSSPVTLTVDTTGLSIGYSDSTILYVNSNDPDEPMLSVPVNLNVDVVTIPPTVDLTSPDGGEAFMGGSAQTISWDMTDDGPMTALTVNLYYSTDGGASYPNAIATGLTGYAANPCTYNWDPVPTLDSTQVRVMVEVIDGDSLSDTDESLANFEIDSTAPAPATNVHAELTGNHVTIYWDASPSADVDRYEIYFIANNWDSTGDTYGFLADTGLTLSHTHNNVGINNPSSYCYQVRTYDVVGHETRTLVQAMKTGSTQSLASNPTGWFLLGNMLFQSDTSLGHVIQGNGLPANWDCVRTYYGNTGQWATDVQGAPTDDLNDIQTNEGFWLHLTGDSRYCSAGYIDDKVIDLYEGWNLVAYPFAERGELVSDIEAHLTANCPNYDGMAIADPTQPYHLIIPTGAETIYHGYGFWVKVTADTTWTVTVY